MMERITLTPSVPDLDSPRRGPPIDLDAFIDRIIQAKPLQIPKEWLASIRPLTIGEKSLIDFLVDQAFALLAGGS